jgi:hypothetical protein
MRHDMTDDVDLHRIRLRRKMATQRRLVVRAVRDDL